ncbi:hypothetical protein BDQ94DRAFT_68940 [Aspergillus welwitschiae]|uniref:Uncharacterized protein n=1 Tax=Aspergillus welwitschiae TaxID=1341132 RepID=A0A3F3PUC1_9EURO|nr:hypothetical protein BDQ94DRAFT_68940 [Aspergillus welwitschiae]RDH30550.1 hypothetical protein BDQ94DRAFT_68940 [Aspergillus welwitschiae]
MGEVIMVMCPTLRVSQPAHTLSLPLFRPECCRFCCRRLRYFFPFDQIHLWVPSRWLGRCIHNISRHLHRLALCLKIRAILNNGYQRTILQATTARVGRSVRTASN